MIGIRASGDNTLRSAALLTMLSVTSNVAYAAVFLACSYMASEPGPASPGAKANDDDRSSSEQNGLPDLRRRAKTALVFALALTAVMGILSWHSSRLAAEDSDWVTHTYAVIDKINVMSGHVVEIATSARAFSLSGQQIFLDHYQNRRDEAQKDLDLLAHLTADNQNEQRRIVRLRQQLAAALQFAANAVTMRQQRGAALNREGLVASERLIDAAHATLDEMRLEEDELLISRDQQTARARRLRDWVTLSTDLLGLLFLLIAGVALQRAIGTSERVKRELDGLNAELSERVIARTAELDYEMSSRAEAEKQLGWSQVRLEGIIQSAMDAIITLDEQQRIVLFNAAAEVMFRCSAAEVMGQSIDRFLPERFREQHGAHVRKFRETGTTNRAMGTLGAIWGTRSNGEEFPIEASISQVESDGQHLFTVILRDISERLRADELLRRALESAPSGILMTDEQGKIMLANTESERLFGYPREELIGQSVDILVPARFRAQHPQHRSAFRDAPSKRTMGRGRDLFGLRKDGGEFPVEVALNPVRTASGVQVLIAIVDITARKKMEQEREEYTLELQRSNAELEQFAYVASHDLQEPLRMVASYTEILGERYRGKLDPNADKYIGYAMDGAQRMQRLIRDLLAYARVSSKAKPLQPTDSSAVVASILSLMRETIEINKAEIVCGTLPTVMADEIQLAQVFQNLINNAIKFHGEHTPRIEISAEQARSGWQFSVKDNGIGMDMENAGRIFQMFQRLHSRDEYEGTGIGLAIAKRIIDRHGGRIWCESALGKGSTFYFTIPQAANLSVPQLAKGASV